MPLDFSRAEPDYQTLVSAIRRAEGGDKAKVPYGILSTKVKNEAEAKQIALNTAKNSYRRWQEAGMPGNFIDHMADRYVPASVDKSGNQNWKNNVASIYQQLASQTPPAPLPAPNPPSPAAASIFSEPLEQIPYAGQLPRYLP